MSEPTPRQLAGFLRRLLRRGAVLVIDPRSRTAVPASVELDGEQIHVLPLLGALSCSSDPEEQRWAAVLERLRKAMSPGEAEELASAVEAERARGEQGPPQNSPARSYMPQST
jgi:hypothetical protein